MLATSIFIKVPLESIFIIASNMTQLRAQLLEVELPGFKFQLHVPDYLCAPWIRD